MHGFGCSCPAKWCCKYLLGGLVRMTWARSPFFFFLVLRFFFKNFYLLVGGWGWEGSLREEPIIPAGRDLDDLFPSSQIY